MEVEDTEAMAVAAAMEAVEVDMEAMAMENKKGDSLNNAAKKPISYLDLMLLHNTCECFHILELFVHIFMHRIGFFFEI